MIPTCKAPDPNPRKPKYKPPAGACDAHCHIFGPGDRYPYAADRTYTPPDAPLSRFKELQSILGLERAVLVNASCHGIDNTVIVDAIAQSGGRYRGVANADDSFTDKEFARLHAAGFRGVRFNFVKHLGGMPDMGEFHRIVARVRPLGWHVDLHFDAGDLVEHAELLDKLPVPFIIDHMGRVPTPGGPRTGTLSAAARRRACQRAVLGQDQRRRAHLERRPALHGRRSFRPGAHRRGAGSHTLGNRLAAPEYRKAHAERRRARRPRAALRAGQRDAAAYPGR